MSSPNNFNEYPENYDISMVSEFSLNSESNQTQTRNFHTERMEEERNRRLEEQQRDNELYISDLEQKIEELNQKILQVNKQIKVEQSTRSEQNGEYQDKIAKLRENIMTLSEKKEISIRAAESEHKRLIREFESRIADRNNEIADLQLKLVSYKRETQESITEIQKLKTLNQTLASKIVTEGRSEPKIQIQLLEGQNSELQTKIQYLQDQLIELTKPPSSSTSSSPETTARVLHPLLNDNSENTAFDRRGSYMSGANGENSSSYISELKLENEQLKRQINKNQIEYILNEKNTPNASPFQTLRGSSFQPGQTFYQEADENLEDKITELERQLEYAKRNEEYMSRIISQLKDQTNVPIIRGRSRLSSQNSGLNQSNTITSDSHYQSDESINSSIKLQLSQIFTWIVYILIIFSFSFISALVSEILGAYYDYWASDGEYIRFGQCPAFISDFLSEIKKLIKYVTGS